MKGERIPIVGLGAFETADVEERIGKNPKTGQPVNIPAHRKPKFKISKTLKDAVR
ncbi:MAG: HU family DNA-binding protein [Thomasclavelia spiroformis]